MADEDEIHHLSERLQLDKLREEVKELRRPWYKKSSQLIALLSAIVPVAALIIGYYATGANKLLDIKRAQLDFDGDKLHAQADNLQAQIERYISDTLVLAKRMDSLAQRNFKILNRNNDLRRDSVSLEFSLDSIKRSYLSVQEQKTRLTEENKIIRKKLESSYLINTLTIMDSIGKDFNPKINEKIYHQLEKGLESVETNKAEAVIINYLSDSTKLISNKLCLTLASFHIYKSEKWFDSFINQLNSSLPLLYCKEKLDFNNISSVLSNNEWDDQHYHSIIKSMLAVISKASCSPNEFLIVTEMMNTRKDKLLSAQNDYSSLLNYFELFRDNIVLRNLSGYSLKDKMDEVVRMSYSKIAQKIFWAEIIIRDSAQAKYFFFFSGEYSKKLL